MMAVGAEREHLCWHFVIYNQNTSDFPGRYLVRPWIIGLVAGVPMPHPFACVCESLEEARESVPEYASFPMKHPMDDKVIVETWM